MKNILAKTAVLLSKQHRFREGAYDKKQCYTPGCGQLSGHDGRHDVPEGVVVQGHRGKQNSGVGSSVQYKRTSKARTFNTRPINEFGQRIQRRS